MEPAARHGCAPRTSPALAAAVALACTLPSSARATNLNWNNTSGGSASISTNWSPVKVPAASDSLFFNLANTYAVSFNGTVDSVLAHTYRKGTVSLSSSFPHTVTGRFTVGSLSGDVVTTNFTGGTFSSASTISIGNGAGSTGTANVNAATAKLQGTGSGSDLLVGFGGTGTLNVTAGGLASCGRSFIAGGTFATASGTTLVSGIGASGSSTLSIGSSATVGSLGTGVLTVDAGGFVSIGKNLVIAEQLNSHGTVTVQNTNSTMTVGGDLHIGTNSNVGSAAGTGTMNVGPTSDVVVTGTTVVGNASGGSGTLHVLNAGTLTTTNLTCVDGHSTLQLDGGQLRVAGGAADFPGTTLTVDGFGGPEVQLLGSTASFDGTGASLSRSLVLGNTSIGKFSVLGGSHLSNVAGVMALGVNTHAEGDLLVSDTGSTLDGAGQIQVGVGNLGTLTVTSGGRVEVPVVSLGTGSFTLGTATVTGANSVLQCDSSLFVGGSATGVGNVGTLTVGGGGTVLVNASGACRLWSRSAKLNVNAGGTMVAFGTIDHRGIITMAGGALTAQHINFSTTAKLSGFGNIQSGISMPASSDTIDASGGALTLGLDTATDGFDNAGGLLRVNGQTVTLKDADGALVGRATLSGGVLSLPPGSFITCNDTLSGNGTIQGHLGVSSCSFINPNATGLIFQAAVTGVWHGIGGQVSFQNGSFTGSGSIAHTTVFNGIGSIITASGGNLTIGFSSGTVTMSGALATGPHTVVILSSAASQVMGKRTSVDSAGVLTHTGGFTIPATDTLTGVSGSISGPLSNMGILIPGAPFGMLTVSGNFTQTAGGKTVIDLGRSFTGSVGTLAVNGTATLGGTLDVHRVPGYVPQPGETYTIMTYTSHSGTFATVTFEGKANSGQFTLVYNPTNVQLVVNNLTTAAGPPAPQTLGFSAHALASGDAEFDVTLPDASVVALRVYDVEGREVAVLSDGLLGVGRHVFTLRSAAHGALPSGMYFGRVRVRNARGEIRRTAGASVRR
jgi:T5SS/PEP-CTERM-associated repeat protein